MKNNHHLLQHLITYSHQDFYPFHMPGHKRAALDFPNPWTIDLTEIEGFDNLHHATGILKELQAHAASLFGAQKSFCLINGSTCGLLTAVSACVKPGEKLLMARNCHKSVYHGVYLRNISPVYVMPQITESGIMGSVSPSQIEQALQQHGDIKAVLIVSPTYDGIVSDIAKIADLAHAYGIPLIVDEAHGAHLPFSKGFPPSALACNADLVVQSLHKTLPAFTQTALLHLCSSRVEEDVVRRFLAIYQSSSPSYLLMASVAQCLAMLEGEGTALLEELEKNLDSFYQECASLSNIQALPRHEKKCPAIFDQECASLSNIQALPRHEKKCPAIFDRDPSKILISGKEAGISGEAIHDFLLKEHHIQLEMAAGHYALALASLMDTKEGFQRLSHGLFHLDRNIALTQKGKNADMISETSLYRLPQQKVSISEALELPCTTILLTESLGAVSQEYLYLYPPGIPLLAPGEVIDETLLENIQRIKQRRLNLQGLADITNTRINIVNL